jgi:hypothetical protein
MAEFSISGRMSVARLQAQFETNYGLELRVYKGLVILKQDLKKQQV